MCRTLPRKLQKQQKRKRAKWGGFASKYIKFGEKQAVKKADEIIVLKDGRVSAKGNRDEILPDLINTSVAVSYCNGVKGVLEDD